MMYVGTWSHFDPLLVCRNTSCYCLGLCLGVANVLTNDSVLTRLNVTMFLSQHDCHNVFLW